jgi:hypothetical protein
VVHQDIISSLEAKSNFNKIEKIRNSQISWLYPDDGLVEIFKKITDIILMLNQKYFNFDLFGITEGLQFTNYTAPSGNYGKHVDRSFSIPIRKLSMSIQLSNPNEYEGGDLLLHEGEEGYWNEYVPTYDECISRFNSYPIAIIDMVCSYKGQPYYAIEICYKNPVSQEKINKLKEFGVDNLIEIDADWILNQTKIPSQLKYKRLI